MPIQVVVAGGFGRMGRAVAAAVVGAPDLELTGLLVAQSESGDSSSAPGPDVTVEHSADRLLTPGCVLVDFTAPAATASLARAAAECGSALVSGATGLRTPAEEALREAAQTVAVLHAPNMSRGIQVLLDLVAHAAATLEGYDCEIMERHHRHKGDAPSGTALRLLARIAGARRDRTAPVQHGRKGDGRRRVDEIGMHALRGGDWVGEHTVLLAGPGETLELCHRAESRAVFVEGALACVRFVHQRPAGLYGMADVLAATAAAPGDT